MAYESKFFCKETETYSEATVLNTKHSCPDLSWEGRDTINRPLSTMKNTANIRLQDCVLILSTKDTEDINRKVQNVYNNTPKRQLLWTVWLCSSKFLCWTSNSKWDGVRRWKLSELIRFRWDHESGGPHDNGYKRRSRLEASLPPSPPPLSLSPFLPLYAMQEYSKKVSVCQPGRGLSLETQWTLGKESSICYFLLPW